LVVDFGVREDRPLVFIKGVTLLAIMLATDDLQMWRRLAHGADDAAVAAFVLGLIHRRGGRMFDGIKIRRRSREGHGETDANRDMNLGVLVMILASFDGRADTFSQSGGAFQIRFRRQ
jgi:hypothetical protein